MDAISQQYNFHCLTFTAHYEPELFSFIDNTRHIKLDVLQKLTKELFNIEFDCFVELKSSGAAVRMYRHACTYRNLINVYFDGCTANNCYTVHVEIKGSAFDDPELNWQNKETRRIVNSVLRHGYTVKEAHLYVDDMRQLLDFDYLWQATAIDRTYRSKMRPALFAGQSDTSPRAFAFGSRPRRISIYEKGRQRYKGEQARCTGAEEEFLDYTRVEIQLSGQQAKDALERYRSHEAVGSIALSYVEDSLNYVVPGLDSNRSRWGVLPAWAAFVSDSTKMPQTRKKTPPTAAGQLAYVEHKISQIAASHGYDAVLTFLEQQTEIFRKKVLSLSYR